MTVRQLAKVTEDIHLESGAVLPAGHAVLIWSIKGDHAGIEWRDDEGTHSMGLEMTKLSIEDVVRT